LAAAAVRWKSCPPGPSNAAIGTDATLRPLPCADPPRTSREERDGVVMLDVVTVARGPSPDAQLRRLTLSGEAISDCSTRPPPSLLHDTHTHTHLLSAKHSRGSIRHVHTQQRKAAMAQRS
jgi:hypothetical protein